MKQMSIREIAEQVGGKVSGDETVLISGLEEIERAQPGQLTFIGSPKYLKFWQDSKASAVLVDEALEISPGDRAVIRVASADLALAPLLELFAPAAPRCESGVHASAVVDSSVVLGNNVSIGPGCYLGPGVKIGDDSVVYANVTVMDHSTIGCRSTLWPGVSIREHCHIGDDSALFQNVSVGSDGFGFRPSPDRKSLIKIPQIGDVRIGNHVEIGANCCIDRGKFSSTVIGDGTKIDNLVQIAHNCQIGKCCAISGGVGLAGTVTLGDHVVIGGTAVIRDHVTVGSHAMIGGASVVISDVEAQQFVSGFPAAPHKSTLQQWAALKKLPAILKSLK